MLRVSAGWERWSACAAMLKLRSRARAREWASCFRVAMMRNALGYCSTNALDVWVQVRILQQLVGATRDANWVDPLLGFAYEVPFADKWRFTLRGDLGGFRIGSEKTYYALARVTYQSSEQWSWHAGYRVISYDFEEGEGRGFQRFDLRQHGPGLGVAFKF